MEAWPPILLFLFFVVIFGGAMWLAIQILRCGFRSDTEGVIAVEPEPPPTGHIEARPASKHMRHTRLDELIPQGRALEPWQPSAATMARQQSETTPPKGVSFDLRPKVTFENAYVAGPDGPVGRRWPSIPETEPKGRAVFRERRKNATCGLHIHYVNGSGTTSDRQVTIRTVKWAYDGVNPEYIVGWDRLAHEQRTFRVDRVLAAVDVRTGEVISDLHRHLRDLANWP